MKLLDFIAFGKSYMEKLPAAPTKLQVPDVLVAEITELILHMEKEIETLRIKEG